MNLLRRERPHCPKRAMDRSLNIIGFIAFAAALSSRAVDPLIPQIAGDLAVSPATAAMLATAFAAYGMIQPILGPVADAVGKMRVMTACLLVLTAASFLCAAVTSFPMLVGLRIVAGAACGGSFPVALAVVSDLVPLAQRQVAVGRLLAATISGNLLGAALAGIVADALGWRSMFVVLGVISLGALALATVSLRRIPEAPRQAIDAASLVGRYRAIFRTPNAIVCYVAVLLEGLFLFGMFPYVAVLLREAGESRASIAGVVVASFAVGGIVYSLGVGTLLRALGQRGVMIGGGLLMALGLGLFALGLSWPLQCLACALLGLGFYMLHASIQVFVTELAPATRSTAVAFHTFSLFAGQGIGPIAFGLGLAYAGAGVTFSICAAALALIGLVTTQLLMRRAVQ
jgi:predicted MFS family arabinose efflux permease